MDSFFFFKNFEILSITSGAIEITLSKELEKDSICSNFTSFPEITKNATGEILTPAPFPPPNKFLSVLFEHKSEPPEANP